MSDTFQVITPVDGSVYVERTYATLSEAERALLRSRKSQRTWSREPLESRQEIVSRGIDVLLENRDAIAMELTMQMGRPIRYTPNELRGVEERARYMIAAASNSLAPLVPDPKAGFTRYITHEPLGIVLVVAPWNYPFLTAINTIVPALVAGNAVILKHSSQTPLVAERLVKAFVEAGLPEHLFQYLHLRDEDTDRLIRSSEFDFVAFTGSVRVGHMVQRAAADGFFGVGLELGGKDPAYVRADADLAYSVEQLVDGAFFNSGQSCCAIERIYVDHSLYEPFVERFAQLAREYVLGDPSDPATTLGPLVNLAARERVAKQIEDALARGARPLVDESTFEWSNAATAYLAPQVLVNVDHTMPVMTEESFGPVIGIMPVRSDEEAVRLMNESAYGLTASIWTEDVEAVELLGREIETGTLFMNRCDYLDPALAWTGVKDSGRGCTLSTLGYQQLTRPKSFHLKLSH